jgi:hypothetical protein
MPVISVIAVARQNAAKRPFLSIVFGAADEYESAMIETKTEQSGGQDERLVRKAKFRSSKWYEEAARSLGITQREQPKVMLMPSNRTPRERKVVAPNYLSNPLDRKRSR